MPPEAENQNTNPQNEKTETESTTDDAGRDVEKDPEDVSGLKSAVAKERDARKAAAADAAKAKEERDALLAEKREREAAEAKRKEAEAKEAGKFQELAEARETERDAAQAEAAALKAENDQYKAAMADGLAAQLKAIPDKLRTLLEDAVPEDDVLGRWQWLHKPSFQELVKDAAGTTEPRRGNEGGPRSAGAGAATVETERKALAARGGYAM